jgi:hypothetical protein
MTTTALKYTLEDINQIVFEGFDYKLNDETLKIISEIALQVGSPDYVRTPVFQKRENFTKLESTSQNKLGKRTKPTEILNDEDWAAIRTEKPQMKSSDEKTNIEEIRINLNKLTDKNYIDIRNKILVIMDKLLESGCTQEEIGKISTIIFDIASTNRFYSKIYAGLYSELSTKYEIMMTTIETNLQQFTDLFNNIRYVDPKINYDEFCEINKINEKRKSLAVFYLNLMSNGIIKKEVIISITLNLLNQFYTFLNEENKKNEIDELTETIALLYKKDFYSSDITVHEFSVNNFIEHIAKSKVKDYKSLTNKSLFKFMDLIDM